MHIRVTLAALSLALPVFAQEAPAIAQADKEKALGAIQAWRGFDGTWEGELRYVAAPKDEWLKQRMPFKLTYANGQPKVYFRIGVRDWVEVGAAYQVHQPDRLTLVVHAYGAGGVWTENIVVVLTRRSENAAEVFVQRVVNNWAGSPKPGEDLVYGDTRAGKAERR